MITESEFRAIAAQGYNRIPLVLESFADGRERHAMSCTGLDLVADWAGAGRPTYAKPTKFEVRDGRF